MLWLADTVSLQDLAIVDPCLPVHPRHCSSARNAAGRATSTLIALIGSSQLRELQGQVVVYAEKQEDSVNKDTKALIILVAVVFALGFALGCCSAFRCCRIARAGGPSDGEGGQKGKARPAKASSSAAAAATEDEVEGFQDLPDLIEPLLPPTSPSPTPPPPSSRYPQSIWVSPKGTQYHILGSRTGLTGAASL